MLEPLSIYQGVIRFDTADSTIRGNNQRVWNSVFKVTRIIDLVDGLLALWPPDYNMKAGDPEIRDRKILKTLFNWYGHLVVQNDPGSSRSKTMPVPVRIGWFFNVTTH